MTAAVLAVVIAACGDGSAADTVTQPELPTTSSSTTDAPEPPPTTTTTAPVDKFTIDWIAQYGDQVDWGVPIAAIAFGDRVVGIIDSDPENTGAAVPIERFADPYITGPAFNAGSSGGGCDTHHWLRQSGTDGGFAFVVVHDPANAITFAGRDDVAWSHTVDGRQIGFIEIDPGEAPPEMRFETADGQPALC